MRTEGIINSLRNCPIFAGVSETDLQSIADAIVVKTLGKGEFLFHKGDAEHGFYVVQSGSIVLHHLNSAGREHIILIYHAGYSFAEGSIVNTSGAPIDAYAFEPTRLLLIPRETALAVARRQHKLMLNLLGAMSTHLRACLKEIEDLALRGVHERLANWLVAKCPDPQGTRPVHITLPATKHMLAAELGTIDETLSRELAKLREQKLITVDGRNITVISPRRLSAVSEK